MVLLVTDADNTLWDTNAVFAKGQLQLLERIEQILRQTANVTDRLGFVRSIDQQLAILHGSELRYPPELLVLGIVEALAGVSPEEAATRVFKGTVHHADIRPEHLARSFLDYLQTHIPSLRTGVSEAIPALHKRGVLIVVATEGKADRCHEILTHYSLASYVIEVVEGRKTATLFADIATRHGNPAWRFVVGDQLDRDIVPGSAAGYRTIYFPGNFTPKWEQNDTTKPDFTVSSFAEVCHIISESGAM